MSIRQQLRGWRDSGLAHAKTDDNAAGHAEVQAPESMKILEERGSRNVPRLRRLRGPGHAHPGLPAWA